MGLMAPRNMSDSARDTVSLLGAAFFTMGTLLSQVILPTFASENARAFSNAPAALAAMGSFASGAQTVTLGLVTSSTYMRGKDVHVLSCAWPADCE